MGRPASRRSPGPKPRGSPRRPRAVTERRAQNHLWRNELPVCALARLGRLSLHRVTPQGEHMPCIHLSSTVLAMALIAAPFRPLASPPVATGRIAGVVKDAATG